MTIVQLGVSWKLLQTYYLGLGLPLITLSVWGIWYFVAQKSRMAVEIVREIFNKADVNGIINTQGLFQQVLSYLWSYISVSLVAVVFFIFLYEILIALTLSVLKEHKAPNLKKSVKSALRATPWALLGLVILGLFILVWFNVNQFILGPLAALTVPLGMMLAMAIFLMVNVIMQDDNLRLFEATAYAAKLWWARQQRYTKTTIVLYVINCILIAYFFLGIIQSGTEYLSIINLHSLGLGESLGQTFPSIFDHISVIIEGFAVSIALIFLVFCSVHIYLLLAKIRLFYSFSRVYHDLGAKKMRDEVERFLDEK